MSSEVKYTLEEDKQHIQKQLGCMNGIFQLFDRRYLLGQRRHGHRHNKLPQGQSVTSNKFNNAADKHKDQAPNKIIKEKQRVSVESSRNSSSSCCSCLNCSKRVQTEPSSFCPIIVSETASPMSNNKRDMCVPSADNIRDVVKDSMTRKPRAVSVKTVAKDGRKSPTMMHIDSPRPSQPHAQPVTHERRDQNLVKETSRFSYDDRESSYKFQSYANIKNHLRLSLDSTRSSIKNNEKVIDQSPTREPESNKPSPSSVVARLMGLDVLNCEAMKIKQCLNDEMILVSNALTRVPLEPAPWKQETEKLVNMKVKLRPACQSVYDPTEKRLTEAMQRTKIKLENTQPHKVKKVNPGRGHGRNLTPTRTKATSRTKKQMSPSHTADRLTGVSPSASPRHRRSKIRKQSNGRLTVALSKTRDRSCRDTRHIRSLSEQSDIVSLVSESDDSIVSHNGPDVDSKDQTRETKNKYVKRLMGYKATVEQPSPVSVLDAFCIEDAPSPVKKKSYATKDDEHSCFDEQDRSQVDDLISSTELNQLTSGSNDIKFENIKQHVYQIKLLNSTSDEATINSHEGTNEDHIYIKEILSASGFLKNLDFATAIVHLHPTDNLINPELFNILEKPEENTSKSEKIKRKLIFDTVNNILVQKLSRTACCCPGQWTSKKKAKILDAGKFLEELCFEINNLHTNKKSEDCHDYCNEVSALVFHIEQLVFKDLISEIN